MPSDRRLLPLSIGRCACYGAVCLVATRSQTQCAQVQVILEKCHLFVAFGLEQSGKELTKRVARLPKEPM